MRLSLVNRRSRSLAALVAAAAMAVSTPSAVRADANDAPRAPRIVRAARRVSVALGATGGEARARGMLAVALSDAIAQNPSLQLATGAANTASLTVTANVRSLTVQRDPAGALARCDLGLVVTDGRGAVRAMLDFRRVVRGSSTATDDSLARTAVRGAADGAVRNLVAEIVR